MTDVKIFEGFRALRRASPGRRRREGKESAERQKGEKGWKKSRITGFFDFFSAKKRKNSEVCDVNLGTLRDKVPYFWAKSAVVLFISQSSEALFSGILATLWCCMRQEMVWNRGSGYQTAGWISPKIIKNFEGKFCHKKSEIACCELAKQGTKQESLQILPTFFLTRP